MGKIYSLILLSVFFLSLCSCIQNNGGSSPVYEIPEPEYPEHTAETGLIRFFNTSSYTAVIHQEFFSGPVLGRVAAGANIEFTVPISDNYGIGSTFSIEYLYKVLDGMNCSCGEVFIGGIDPNIQIVIDVQANKKYMIQIPQPEHLIFETAFLKILNTSSQNFELWKNGVSYKQTGNGTIPVLPGETGVYEISSSSNGVLYEGFELRSVFESIDVPVFSAYHSYIYTFLYDGKNITPLRDEKILFGN